MVVIKCVGLRYDVRTIGQISKSVHKINGTSGDVMNKKQLRKHNSEKLFQELFDRAKQDGVSAFLPHNLSDQHIAGAIPFSCTTRLR